MDISTLCAIIAVAALLVNAVTFLQFGADKRRAQAGLRRIPEANLLRLAVLGGTPAAYAARHHFRHKTRKQPFSTYLAIIAMVQAGIGAGLAWTFVTYS